MKQKILLSLFVLMYLFAVLSVPITADDCSGVAGDVNNSGSVTIGDLVYLHSYLFLEGPAPPCMDQADANCSGNVTISDYLFIHSYLFLSGPEPIFCQSEE